MRMRFLLYLLLVIPGLMTGSAHALQQALHGDATLGMQRYSGESAGIKQEAESIYQQYTVTYSRKDTFYNGRAGAYTLMAGYELNFLDPSFERNGVRDPEIVAINTSKLYYDGTLVLAPGGLPFRLTLYARDTKRTTFVDNARYESFATGLQSTVGGHSGAQMLQPSINTDVDNGTSQMLGATLLIGIRNGTYLGAYRDVLSQLPRLLIDYKQNEVKDLQSSFNKTHFLYRDLAFVSLNKKDNWVHLRMRDHTDFLNHANDTEVKQVLIGTIDHNLSRQWINLTNWIKVSGDLSYTEEKKVGVDPFNTYLANMFFTGQQQGLSSNVFTWFRRENDGHFAATETTIPVYVSKIHNRDTKSTTRFIYEEKERTLLLGQWQNMNDPSINTNLSANDFTDYYLDNHFELFRSRPVIVKPRIELEARSQGEEKDGLAARLGVEVLSNSKLNTSFNWLAGYALTTTRSNATDLDAGGTFIQNEVYGRVDKNLSRSLRVGGKSHLTIGSGEGRDNINFLIATMSADLPGAATRADEKIDSNYSGMLTRGELSLYLDHRYQRLGNRIDATFDYFMADSVTKNRSTFQHALTFTDRSFSLDWKSNLTIGENSTSPRSVGFDYIGRNDNADSSVNWDSRLIYDYHLNRSSGFTLTSGISGSSGGEGGVGYTLSEKFYYRLFTSNGIIRRLAEFSEEIGYEKVTETFDGRDSALYGRFSAMYFPTHHLYGKVSTEIAIYPGVNAQQQISTGELGFDFEKLKIMANYSQAYKERESELLPEIREERWEVKVKKLF